MKSLASSLASSLRSVRVYVADTASNLAPDAMLIAGTAGVAYGAWLIYAPAGFIIGGALLIAGGYLSARRAD